MKTVWDPAEHVTELVGQEYAMELNDEKTVRYKHPVSLQHVVLTQCFMTTEIPGR